jgi:VCBS repeat-containing protein
MSKMLGVAAAHLVAVVDGSDGVDLAAVVTQLKKPRRRQKDLLAVPAISPLSLMALAACSGGASTPSPAPAPTVVAPTITPAAPPALVAGAASTTGNVLPAANQSGASAATVSAVSLVGGASGTVGQPLATPLGDITLNNNGGYSFTVANNDTVKSLPNGASQDITINFTAGNSAGSASSSIKFTVTGINDVPVASNDSITAPAVITAAITGNVLGNDSDIDRGTTLVVTAITAQAAQISASQGSAAQTAQAAMAATGTFGSISMNSDGRYSYTLDKADADFTALRGDQTATEKFEYTVSDGAGGSAKAVLSITITGVNDAPSVPSQNISLDSFNTVGSGTLLRDAIDGDRGTVLRVDLINGTPIVANGSYAGQFGTLQVALDGTYTYNLNLSDPDYVALQQTDVVRESFAFRITDDNGGTANSTLNFDVRGRNDAPVLISEIFTVTGSPRSGEFNLFANDSDPDTGTVLRIVGVSNFPFGDFTTLTPERPFSDPYLVSTIKITSDGKLIYTLFDSPGLSPDRGYDRLAEGEVDSRDFYYAVSDGQTVLPGPTRPPSEAVKATIRIVGVNDAPTVVSTSGAVTEDAALNTITGMLTVSDIDNGQTASIASVNGSAFAGTFASFNGAYGTLGLNSNGAWTYTLDNARAATNALAGGQQATETFAITASDPLGATGTGDIVVTVTGAAENISAVADSGASVIENAATIIATGNVLTNDIGTGLFVNAIDGVSASVGQSVVGTYGSIVIARNGGYTYTLNNLDTDTNGLAAGILVNDVFSYSISNGLGGTASSTISVGITGTNDVPIVETNKTLDVALGGSSALNIIAPVDPDSGETVSLLAQVIGLPTFGVIKTNAGIAVAANSMIPISELVNLNYSAPNTIRTAGDFIYRISDVNGANATQTIALNSIALSTDRVGTSAADTLTVASPFLRYFGFNGNDTFVVQTNLPEVGMGQRLIDGGGGTDTIDFSAKSSGISLLLFDASMFPFISVENVVGTNFDDRIEGDPNSNRIEGLDGSDLLSGGNGNDVLLGGSNADTLIGGSGADILDGGSDPLGVRYYDWADYSTAPSSVNVALDGSIAFTGDAIGDTLVSIESLRGSNFGGTLIGDDTSNQISGGNGNDIIIGGDNVDTLAGGSGDDLIYAFRPNGAPSLTTPSRTDESLTSNLLDGGNGNDTLYGANWQDTIYGGDGDDTIYSGNGVDLIYPGAGNDYIDGGSDFQDVINYFDAQSFVSVNLQTGASSGGSGTDTIINITKVTGSNFNDILTARDYNGIVFFSRLDGADGDDNLIGGNYSDELRGGPGADRIDGRGDIDILDYRNSDDSIRVDLRTGFASGGHASGDTLSNVESISGTNFSDVLIGLDAIGALDGYAGNDILVYGRSLNGFNGDDVIVGASRDSIGNAGNDILVMFEFNNDLKSIFGGSGNDIFVFDTFKNYGASGYNFNGSLIDDFTSGQDKIDLSDFRDSQGNILDINDILDNDSSFGGSTTISLANFTSQGQSVSGLITLGGFTAVLTASDFIFSNGPDWQAMLPVDLLL